MRQQYKKSGCPHRCTGIIAGIVLLGAALLSGGCARRVSQSVGDDGADHLTMYLIGNEGEDHDRVMQKLNEMLREDLNCTLTVKYIGLGDYVTKYPLILSSGEQIDLIMSANWLNYSGLSQQGVFLPIEDLVETYCPESSRELDLAGLMEGQPDGHLYMLPCNYTEPAAWGAIVRGDVMDELGYDSIDSMDEYFQFCIDAAASTDFVDSTSQSLHLQEEVILYENGYCPVDGSSGAAYWFNVKKGDETGIYTVYNKAEVPELQPYFKKAQDLFSQGAWSVSALSNTDADLMQEGHAASFLHLPNRWVNIAISNPEADVRFFNLSDPVYIPSEHAYIGMSVPITAAYPEKALQILELLHQNEAYFDLLTYGLEGIHYTISDETGKITLMNQKGYGCENGTWGFRDTKFMREVEGTPAEFGRVQEEIKGILYENKFRTFLLDTGPIRTELEAVHEVMERDYTLMNMGYTDYESGMRHVKEALREAGNEVCKKEIQRQVDQFAAGHPE